MTSGEYILVQLMSFPNPEIGHIAVIVEYDEENGFKIKETDEEKGKVTWIPLNHMTWLQCSATEECFEHILYPQIDEAGNQVFDQPDRGKVIQRLKRCFRNETGQELETDFTERSGQKILDFGFVLKFKRTCQCQGDTCEHFLKKKVKSLLHYFTK